MKLRQPRQNKMNSGEQVVSVFNIAIHLNWALSKYKTLEKHCNVAVA